jgi:3-oxocholest-4-en-26-oate---CoA ligase
LSKGNAVSGWNIAEVFETVAAAIPDAPAQRSGDRHFTWAAFNDRANALATDLLSAGLGHQSKVAAYLTNGPEYLETYFASAKVAMVPVNTNYRYGPDEIRYLFDNADAEAVVFHASYASVLNGVRAELTKVKRWYVVADPDQSRSEAVAAAPWATPYEDVVSATDPTSGVGNARGPWGVSGDDLVLLYTGGTTGMPKGVMWRQDDLFNVLGQGGQPTFGMKPVESLAELAERTVAPGPVMMPACPLMHGTGQFTAFIVLTLGGCVVTNPRRSFSAEDFFDIVERESVNWAVIVGDAFAKPLLAALDANPHRWDLSSLTLVTSSGVMWSQETKDGLLEHLEHTLLVDSYGSSEAVGLGASASSKGRTSTTAQFQLGPTVHVFTDDNRRVAPGSDEKGFVAISGFVPIGYYKDEVKSAQTFRVIDGVRYSVPGDFARVNVDGTLLLLGRGSVCINTGGEKVFPEEVEEVLKVHVLVADAVCVGIPDDRFGQVICAVIEPQSPSAVFDEGAVLASVAARLARYKTPRHVVLVDTIGRSPSGKVDYKHLTALALERLGR